MSHTFLRPIILAALSLILSIPASAQRTLLRTIAAHIPAKTQNEGPALTFEVSKLSYGTIKKNSNPARSVRFTNTGDSPLTISHIQSSCGCLSTTFPKTAFAPGESGSIELNYDTKRVGAFQKTITVNLSGQSGRFSLNVVGEVLESEETDGSKVVVVMPKSPASKPKAEPTFSSWYTAKVDGNHTLSCRYKAMGGGRIELELMCTDGCRFEVSSKLCSRSSDGGNGWKSVRLTKDKVSKVTIYEEAKDCQDGFWWWFRKYKTTSVRCANQ
jgi:Protein of unknown function (DUF1573)